MKLKSLYNVYAPDEDPLSFNSSSQPSVNCESVASTLTVFQLNLYSWTKLLSEPHLFPLTGTEKVHQYFENGTGNNFLQHGWKNLDEISKPPICLCKYSNAKHHPRMGQWSAVISLHVQSVLENLLTTVEGHQTLYVASAPEAEKWQLSFLLLSLVLRTTFDTTDLEEPSGFSFFFFASQTLHSVIHNEVEWFWKAHSACAGKAWFA